MKLWLRGAGGLRGSERPDRIVAGLHAVALDERAPPRTVVPGVDGFEDGSFLGAWPGAADEAALAGVTEGLGPGACWSRLVEAVPVVASFDGSLELTAVELALDAELGALQAVCRAPRMLLRHDEEREPVSRARRVSSRTIADLVARPSDWEHRTLRSIRPARVLSVVPENDLDLYENRVVARLLDRLDALLSRRLEELAQVRGLLADGHNFSDETRGSHWRAKRLSTVWERVEHDDTLRERAAAAHRTVGRLRDGVRALFDSALYRTIPRGTQVDDALRPTNILVNDAAYRRVAALWRVVVSACARAAPSREETVRRRLALSERFDAFGTLLTIQALAGLGYAPRDDRSALDDRPLALIGPRGELSLRRCDDGALMLSGDAGTIAIVALPVRVTTAETARLCEQLRGDGTRDALYLLLGRPDDSVLQAGVEDAERRVLSGWSQPRVLLVSPWSLDASERVARVLGAWDAGGRLSRFPAQVPWRGESLALLPPWVGRAGGALAVARPPSAEERSRFGELLRTKHAELTKRNNTAGTASATGVLQRLRELMEAAEALCWLARCPVCQREGARFDERWQESSPVAQQTIWARCEGCEAAWGLHACGTCGERYAVLDPGVALACPDDVIQLDRTYGRDLWCEPHTVAGKRKWRCAQCASGRRGDKDRVR